MRHLLPLLLLTACGLPSPGGDGDTDAPTVVQHTAVLHTVDFAREADGVTRGFDLDGEPDACDTPDFTSPDGTPGIDNNFATLLPLMERVGGAAFEDLIQGAVDSGEFLLVVRVTDDGTDCARLEVFRAAEPGLVGADGQLLANQTLPVLPTPMMVAECAVWEDDHTVLATGQFLPLQIEIFDEAIDLGLELASFRVHLGDDGTAWGEAGGAIEVADLWICGPRSA